MKIDRKVVAMGAMLVLVIASLTGIVMAQADGTNRMHGEGHGADAQHDGNHVVEESKDTMREQHGEDHESGRGHSGERLHEIPQTHH